MRAAVQQIFTLQVQRGMGSGSDVLTFGQRSGTSRIVLQQVGKLGLKLGIFLRTDKRVFQLTQSRHQDLRHIHATEFTKIGIE